MRAIPASTKGRQVLVDAAGARLWMYENGQPVDSMKVVVGKDEMPTPMMAGFIRTAIVNPYWQVPDDLVQNSIAASVLSKGIKYLKERQRDEGGGKWSWEQDALAVGAATAVGFAAAAWLFALVGRIVLLAADGVPLRQVAVRVG